MNRVRGGSPRRLNGLKGRFGNVTYGEGVTKRRSMVEWTNQMKTAKNLLSRLKDDRTFWEKLKDYFGLKDAVAEQNEIEKRKVYNELIESIGELEKNGLISGYGGELSRREDRSPYLSDELQKKIEKRLLEESVYLREREVFFDVLERGVIRRFDMPMGNIFHDEKLITEDNLKALKKVLIRHGYPDSLVNLDEGKVNEFVYYSREGKREVIVVRTLEDLRVLQTQLDDIQKRAAEWKAEKMVSESSEALLKQSLDELEIFLSEVREARESMVEAQKQTLLEAGLTPDEWKVKIDNSLDKEEEFLRRQEDLVDQYRVVTERIRDLKMEGPSGGELGLGVGENVILMIEPIMVPVLVGRVSRVVQEVQKEGVSLAVRLGQSLDLAKDREQAVNEAVLGMIEAQKELFGLMGKHPAADVWKDKSDVLFDKQEVYLQRQQEFVAQRREVSNIARDFKIEQEGAS